MKRKIRRRVGGIVLASTMLISTIPTTAIAADENSVDLVDINPSGKDADTLVVTNMSEDTPNNTLDTADMSGQPDTRDADSTNWIELADTTWYNENDTTFTIDTAEELAGLAKLVNEGNDFSKKTIKLGENIDLNGKEWTPIGTSSNVFSGTFDGQSHTISNLSINKPNSTHQGLFGYIKGNGYTTYLVTDLELNNVNIIGNNYTGALSGQAFTCGIENVTVSGNVIGGRYVGGLIGHVYTRFDNCNFTGSVTGAYGVKDQIGGIAGSGDGRFYNCTAIQGDDCEYLVKGDNWNGGIIGGGQESTCAVDCYVKGDIVSASEWYGCSGAGIAGEAGMYASCIFTGNYFDGIVYCDDEVVDAPIIGLVNTDDTNVLSKMTVKDNSWNTENYPADLTVAVAAMDNKSFDDIVAEATRTEPRNMNLVGSISDLEYMEAGNLKIVGAEVTTEKLQEFAANSGGAYEVTVDSDTGIITIQKVVAKINDTTYSTLEDAVQAANNTAGSDSVIVEITKSSSYAPFTITRDNVTVQAAEGIDATFNISADSTGNINGEHVTLKGLDFVSTDGTTIFSSGDCDDLTLEGCTFTGDETGTALYIHKPNITITGCTFEDFERGYYTCGDNHAAGAMTFTNNIFTNVRVPIDGYWGKTATATTNIQITGNTFDNGDWDAAYIQLWDYAQYLKWAGNKDDDRQGSAIKATISDNTYAGNVVIYATHFDWFTPSELTLDEASTALVKHRYLVELENADSATIRNADGSEITAFNESTTSSLHNGKTVIYSICEGDYIFDIKPTGATEAMLSQKVTVSKPETSGATNTVTVPAEAGKVAQVGNQTYTSLADAINDAKNGGTVKLLSDVKIDAWNQVWDIDGLTIEGNNHTITIDKVESNVNGNYLFYDAKNLNVSDLTIKFNTNGNGFSMISGQLDNVKMYGGENSNYAIFVGSSNDSAAKVEISNCLFYGFKGTAVYSQPATSESATSTISVDKTTFTNCGMTMCSYAPNTSFTNNIVTGGSEVSFAAAAEDATRDNAYTITGNTFNDAGKIWFYGADLENVNFEKNAVTGETTISTEEAKGTLDASGNHWGEGADLAEIAKKLVGSVNIDSYYTDAEMTNEVQVGGILVATAEQLENAIANAKAGDVIVLAPGTYEVDKLVFDASKSNITIKGSGMEQTTLKSKSGQYIVEIKDLNQTVSGLKFEDLTLDGNNKASALVKVDSQTKCRDITFNRVAFKNATQSGINVASGSTAVETGTITVSGCAFSEINGGSASAYAIYAARGNLKVEKSKFDQIDSTNGTGAGILFDTANFGDQSYNLSVTDSEFTKITGTDSDQKGTGGVTVTGPNKIDTLVITGNTFADNTTDIRIGKSDAAPVIETVTVENNGNAQIVVPDEDAKYFTATFICDEQMLSKSLSDRNGEIVTPSAPSKEDYKFKGWQSSINGKIYDSDTAVVLTDDTTFTAVWDRISSGGASHPEAGGSSSSSDRYEISKPSDVENGSIKVSDTKAEKGDTVTITVTPDEGYELDELVVYDEDGDEIDLKDKGDGKFTFEMPKGDVEIEVSFAAISDETPKADFVDVPADAWYAEAVQYVYENGMMSGTSETTFSPDLTTTRGMIVTILYRLEGTPDLSNENLGYPYADVDANAYYADAVYWARQNGIVSGMSAEQFAPNNAITREQMAAILYRYAQFKGYDVSAKADLSVYTDAASVGAYATDAMAWANGAQLITGTSTTTLTPAGQATRAQVATILMRFCENIAK